MALDMWAILALATVQGGSCLGQDIWWGSAGMPCED